MTNFLNKYKKELTDKISQIDNDVVIKIINLIDSTEDNGSVYIIGNGGSAATASHMANDWGIGLKRRRIKNFNIISLADNSAITTAIANDIGYENIFYEQLRDCIKKDDILIAISCSGNSKNIIKAVQYAKEKHIPIIGLTGFDGGDLKKLSDINFHVNTKKGEYGIVEDLHMILDHMLYSYYIDNN